MSNRKLLAFISSRMEELATERDIVRKALKSVEVDAWLFEKDAGARFNTIQTTCLKELEAADIFIGLFWKGYGDYSIEEYEHAQKLGKPCLIYEKRTELDKRDDRLQEFLDSISQVESGLTVQWFYKPEEIEFFVRRDISSWLVERAREHNKLSIQVSKITKGLKVLSNASEGKIRNFFEEYLGTNRKKIPFGGRQNELNQLDEWLNDQNSPPYGLIAAEAGRGKSTLLARWAHSVAERGLSEVIFIPVSIRFDTAKANICFTALAARLGEIYGEYVDFADLSAEHWRGVCLSYLKRQHPKGKQVLLIMDGLDEAVDWRPDASLFPTSPPKGLRVVVSARYQAGDINESGWLNRLNWDTSSLAISFPLPPLTREGVKDVLVAMGQPLDYLSAKLDIIDQLHRLSEGDPLLVRLYVESLLEKGKQSAFIQRGDLVRNPKGWDGYFGRWWQEQKQIWGKEFPMRERVLSTVLSLLSCALGPLFHDDIFALISSDEELNTWTLDESMDALGRFVVGDGKDRGYVFSHPKLAQYFYDNLSQIERQYWGKRFLVYGKRILDELSNGGITPEQVPEYCLKYYGVHLDRENSSDNEILSLVSKKWMKAWYALDGMYSGFLNDVDRAAERVRSGMLKKQGNLVEFLGWQIKCGLCKSSVVSLSTNVQPQLLTLALSYNIISATQAIIIAKQTPSSYQKADVLKELAPYIPASLMEEAVTITQTIANESLAAGALNSLAPYLSELLVRDAFEIVKEFKNDQNCVLALGGLIPHLPEDLVTETLSMAKEMDNEWQKAEALSQLAPRMSEVLLEDVLRYGRSFKDKANRVITLCGLVPLMPESKRVALVTETLAIIDTIKDNRIQVSALCRLAPYLSKPVRASKVSSALISVNYIQENAQRKYSLEELVPHLSEEQRLVAVKEILELTIRHFDNNSIWAEISRLAPYISGDMLVEIVASIQKINNERLRASAMIGLIPSLPEKERLEIVKEVLELTKHININWNWEELNGLLSNLPEETMEDALDAMCTIYGESKQEASLNWLIPYLPEEHKKKKIREALSATQTVGDERNWANALTILAQHLPKDAMGELLTAAKVIDDEISRSLALSGLAPSLPEEQRWTTIKEAVVAARDITIEDNQKLRLGISGTQEYPWEAIQGIFRAAQTKRGAMRHSFGLNLRKRFLPNWFISEMFSTIQTIRNENIREYAIEIIAPYLPEPLINAVLVETQLITDERKRVAAFCEFARFLPKRSQRKMLNEVLEVAMSIDDGESRSYALEQLLQYLPNKQWQKYSKEALFAAQTIDEKENRAHAFRRLSQCIPDDQWREVSKEAWETTIAINDKETRASAFIELIPLLPDEHRQDAISRAFEIIRGIEDFSNRAEAFLKLRPYLPTKQKQDAVDEAFDAIKEIADEWRRAYLLTKMAPYFYQELTDKSLSVALSIEDGKSKAYVLTRLVDRVPEEKRRIVFTSALKAIQAIENEDSRSSALSTLASDLPGDLIEIALEIALNIKIEGFRAKALVELFPYLPDSLMTKAFEATLALEHQGSQEFALRKIIPKLSKEQKKLAVIKAVHMTLNEEDERSRANALDDYVLHLVEIYSGDKAFAAHIIKSLSVFPRSSYINDLLVLLPFLKTCVPKNEQEHIVLNVFKVMQEIRGWWP